MAYLPNSDADRGAMLAAVGVREADQLFSSVPPALLHPPLELPPPLGEQELVAELTRLSQRNHPLGELDSFLGAGVYHRFIPAIVAATIGRPEFYTAYTPYQAEASQGTLQTIFEFQSMICALTGLDVANASLYDGATSVAEAALLAVAHTGRGRIAVSRGLHPEALQVLRTSMAPRGIGIDEVELDRGVTPHDGVRAALDERHAALIVAQPAFSGCIEDLAPLGDAAHAVGALAVASVDLHACAVLIPPGEAGFDVAVGEAQPLGIPLSYGGPHCGVMSVRQALVRRIPGRLVGLTRDHRGRRAYTLTLQTREQHIRREHATSNICTNHALMALAATTYMAHMGAPGLRGIAEVSAQRAHALAARLASVEGFELAHPTTPFLWEFVLRTPVEAETVVTTLRERGIVAGLPLCRVEPAPRDLLLVCCTELTRPEAIDRYADAAGSLAARSPSSVAAGSS